MDLKSAAQREVAVHNYARYVSGVQLGCGRAANVSLKCDVVYKISRELETVTINLHPTAQDSQLDDFIPEAVSPSDPKVSEVSLGDFYLSGEPIVGGARFDVQSGLSTGVHSNDWL
jgi:hypothetical protein